MPEFTLRSYRDADREADAAIRNRRSPDRPSTAEELRRRDEMPGAPERLSWVAERSADGRVLGIGSLEPSIHEGAGSFEVGLYTDPTAEGSGVGRALADRVEAEARKRDARVLMAAARAGSERGLRFLERRGYAEVARYRHSRLDLSRADLPPLPDRTEALAREGITFTTWAELSGPSADALAAIVELNVALSADYPQPGPYDPASVRHFLEEFLRGPTVVPEAFFLARSREGLVGMSYGTRIPLANDSVQHQMTGVRRELRGHGIALELKRRTVGYARERGYRYIWTNNHLANAPMLAINARIGFEPVSEWVVGRREMDLPG